MFSNTLAVLGLATSFVAIHVGPQTEGLLAVALSATAIVGLTVTRFAAGALGGHALYIGSEACENIMNRM